MLRTNLKIALVSSATDLGDSEKVLWTLGTGLIDRGHQVLWVCGKSSKLLNQVESHGYASCPLPEPAMKPIAFLSLRKACVSKGIQIMLANDSQARTWGSIAMVGRLGLKRIQYKHNLRPPYSTAPYHWMLDRLVCVSNQVRKTCIDSGLVASKVSTIEIGVDTPQLEKWKERFWACEFLGISQRTPLFCSISDSELSSGRIFRKHVQIIEAANHVRWHLPDFCVVVACPDENVAELRRLVIKYSLHSHFRFVGLGEVERWISASDVMIQNETNLGYSIVATQAHLMGTKVVVSGEIGSKELGCTPQQEWTNAFQCDHDDPSSLASTLVKALGAQDRSVQSKGHDGALLPTRFQASKMVQNFENLFYETLAVQRTHRVGRLAG